MNKTTELLQRIYRFKKTIFDLKKRRKSGNNISTIDNAIKSATNYAAFLVVEYQLLTLTTA